MNDFLNIFFSLSEFSKTLVCLPLILIPFTMGDILGFTVKAKWDLIVRTEIHIFGHIMMALQFISFNKFITFKMSLSCVS